MTQEKRTIHYLILFLGVSTTGILFLFFKYNILVQTIVALAGCIFYVLWGIIHHAAASRLSRLIVLEYVLIGCVIFLLLFTAVSI